MITQSMLLELFEYNPENGFLLRRVCRKHGTKIGGRAGSQHHTGYRVVGIDGKTYLEHRVIFMMMTGRLPIKHIDHINGVKSDNSWTNLREASMCENMRNRPKHRCSRSKYKGVYWAKHAKQWQVRVKRRYIGYYKDENEAAMAYNRVALEEFGDFALLNIINGEDHKDKAIEKGWLSPDKNRRPLHLPAK